MVRAAAVIVAVALAGCQQSTATSDNELDRVYVARLAGRVDALEDELRELREHHDADSRMIASLIKRVETTDKYNDTAMDRLFKNDETFRARVNWLSAQHGQGALAKSD